MSLPNPGARSRVPAITLSLLLVTVLAACGGGTAQTDSTADASNTAAGPAPASNIAPSVAAGPPAPPVISGGPSPAPSPATAPPAVLPPAAPPLATPTGAGTAKVAWDAPATLANGEVVSGLMGFRVYYGSVSGTYSASLYAAGATASSATVTGLGPGTWYFTVTSIDALGNESSLGYEMSKSLPLKKQNRFGWLS